MGSNQPVPLAMKPGDDLLFHRLGDSTIGAVRFHGRVRDGIGWGTDAMATKLQSERTRDPIEALLRREPRKLFLEIVHIICCDKFASAGSRLSPGSNEPKLSLMVGFIKREQSN